MSADLKQFKDELLRDLRAELIALHLGDDYTITREEAAHLLGVSVRQMYRLEEDGSLPVGYVGNSPRYSLGMIRRFMRESVMPKR